MSFSSLSDSEESERVQNESCTNFRDAMDDFDVSTCKRFPSIILGNSPQVELYDETMSCDEAIAWSGKNHFLVSEIYKGLLSGSLGAKSIDPDCFYELLPSLQSGLPSANSSLFRDGSSYELSLSAEPLNIEAETNSDPKITVDDSSTRALPEILPTAGSVELILDNAISCIPGLSKRQCHQLENCGFHTLRKLLHHFPRTYADLQNAQFGIDDGQYLIFIGKILSSK
ncbi:unnamed protein product [Thlaspi arvense]|uniref:Uncharacterized protein n=1 Tax=Thlaspi arvense TaxID=13288 RepID=A0AAU9S697_THLAR|nr:unnamed protein product [Thlaspi arvense]